MKKFFALLFFIAGMSFSGNVNAQILKKLTGGDKDSGGNIAAGLKEALSIGAETAAKNLSAVDGYFANAAVKILMPEEAKKVEEKLRTVGMGKQVDDAILSMNRAAEDAAKSATPIFVNAIKQMSIQDAAGILSGGDFAATDYLKSKTTAQLTEAFRPVIEKALEKADATKHWNTVFTAYNKFTIKKINPDLTAYVTERALSGIFYQVAQEEQKIRKDPLARTTDLLKSVFGK
ncbi:MAG: DUF4197 domain-containing protein [Chitinophagaceae bacterium]|nr:DUF4197 domain-containing protein [Chitinophagaceae bacterium]MCW5927072.1 DUF4197 domain-containing protein [Chitinophagaceae bacterium]